MKKTARENEGNKYGCFVVLQFHCSHDDGVLYWWENQFINEEEEADMKGGKREETVIASLNGYYVVK